MMQDWIGFLFLFSDWSRKIAPPPLSFKCKKYWIQSRLSLKRFSAFQPGFVFMLYSEFPFPLCDIFLCLD